MSSSLVGRMRWSLARLSLLHPCPFPRLLVRLASDWLSTGLRLAFDWPSTSLRLPYDRICAVCLQRANANALLAALSCSVRKRCALVRASFYFYKSVEHCRLLTSKANCLLGMPLPCFLLRRCTPEGHPIPRSSCPTQICTDWFPLARHLNTENAHFGLTHCVRTP